MGGRIWIMWNPGSGNVQLLEEGAQYMHCLVTHLLAHKCILVSFVYAQNRAVDRLVLWDRLRYFSMGHQIPWACLGDFNVSLVAKETLGCILHQREIIEFKDCLAASNLADHPYTGGLFTWHNKQGASPKWSKLDRALVNAAWYTYISISTVVFLPARVSDHSSILLSINSTSTHYVRPFRYLNCWALSPDFHACVTQGWQLPTHGRKIYSLLCKHRNLKKGLKSLHCPEFSGLLQRVEEAKNKLVDCQLQMQASPLNTLLLAQEKKSRTIGNTIGVIEDVNGTLCQSHAQVAQAFLGYYRDILGTSKAVTPLLAALFAHNTLTSTEHLVAPVTHLEIEAALFAIHRDKSPGIDGYSYGGDLPSIQDINDCLSCFAAYSGWKANPMKTSLYFRGVPAHLKAHILSSSGYVEGNFPVKHLGIRLFSSRLTYPMFASLLDKIRRLGSSVLLPKGIAKKLNKLCKDFLWGIEPSQCKHVFKSWDSFCRPREEGLRRTGFSEMRHIFSRALIFGNFNLLRPTHGSGVALRDLLVQDFGGDPEQAWVLLFQDDYKAQFYEMIRAKGAPFIQSKTFWDSFCYPKHKVIGLLTAQNRLPTVDALCSRGLVIVNRCVLCESSLETHSHLFFECPYSAAIWQAIAMWLKVSPAPCLPQIFHWFKVYNRGQGLIKKQGRCALMCALYLVWQERNKRIFKGIQPTPVTIIRKIKVLVLLRLSSL
ncbi:uncharacterized protein LOC141588398 [Silene latifolia]|uniref:uncharacterized protein LOC141588398 n=1 Tax=Silene latifolia TaxID=37657 RepID=UPI003D78173E